MEKIREMFIKGAAKLVICGVAENFSDYMNFQRSRLSVVMAGWTSVNKIVKRNIYDMRLRKKHGIS